MTDSTSGKTPRRIPAAEAARLVRSGDWVDYGAAVNQPDVFDAANVATIVQEWGGTPSTDELAARTRWRDQRLAALAAHKKTQTSS